MQAADRFVAVKKRRRTTSSRDYAGLANGQAKSAYLREADFTTTMPVEFGAGVG